VALAHLTPSSMQTGLGTLMHRAIMFFLTEKQVSKHPESASLQPRRRTNYRKAPQQRGNTTHTHKKCKKDPAQNRETRSGPSASTSPPMKSLQQTAIPPPPGSGTTWCGTTSRSRAALKQRSGCPTPIQSGRGGWNHAAPCRRRRASMN
jgi:hypothetical protein